MTEEEQAAADKARKDADEKAQKDAAEQGSKLDKLLSGLDALGEKFGDMSTRMDAMNSRMDSFEKKEDPKADATEEGEDKTKAEQMAADKARKDADDKEAEEKAQKDAAATVAGMESKMGAMAATIADMAAKLPIQVTDADFAAMAESQARADAVYMAMGSAAPRPMQGETPLAYRRRLVKGMQEHSATWKAHDLTAIGDSAFPVAEEQIYNDAMTAAHSPATVPAATLRQITKRDETGREVKTFVGDPSAWMRPMMGRTRRVTHINVGSQGVH